LDRAGDLGKTSKYNLAAVSITLFSKALICIFGLTPTRVTIIIQELMENV
jgi:hypothetical protein